VYAACPRLETLLLTCCGYLGPQSLDPLLRAPAAGVFYDRGGGQGPALPALTTLDVSYCPLPARSIVDLLTCASRLEVRYSLVFPTVGNQLGDGSTHGVGSSNIVQLPSKIGTWRRSDKKIE